MLCEEALVATDPKITSLGQNLEVNDFPSPSLMNLLVTYHWCKFSGITDTSYLAPIPL